MCIHAMCAMYAQYTMSVMCYILAFTLGVARVSERMKPAREGDCSCAKLERRGGGEREKHSDGGERGGGGRGGGGGK